MKRTVTCYVDSTHFQHHLTDDPQGCKFYNTVENCRAANSCISTEELSCGIYEVEITFKKIIQEGTI